MNSTERPRPVSVAALQMACSASKQDNVERALDGIAEAARRGAQIVCLQELFHGPYPCQREDHDRFAEAEPLDGPICQALGESAGRHRVVVVGSIFERRAAGVYHNTAVVFDVDGRRCGVYRKMHIPDDPFYYEKFYFTPGDLGFQRIRTQVAELGVGVCWDQWFPEAARMMALEGAEILLYPTAIGWLPDEKERYGPSQHSAWETMMRSHAIANGVYVVAANRTGREDQLQFWGASFAADPYGNVLARADHDTEAILLVDCDLTHVETARTHWPFFRDRRVDAYHGLTRRWRDDTGAEVRSP